ncbi:MAG: hypothetical protein U5K56_16825 [Halioglobus sp.]|nr:hypothetical protein [Halioglobus sp.]
MVAPICEAVGIARADLQISPPPAEVPAEGFAGVLAGKRNLADGGINQPTVSRGSNLYAIGPGSITRRHDKTGQRGYYRHHDQQAAAAYDPAASTGRPCGLPWCE